MRSRTFRVLASFVAVIIIVPSAYGRTKNFKERMGKAVAGSVTGVGTDFLVKFAGGILYNTTCKPPSDDTTAKFLCDILGGMTGQKETEWKEQVEKQLKDIKAATDELTKGQSQIQAALTKIDTKLDYKFDNIAPASKMYETLLTIDRLWTRYSRLMSEVPDATTDEKRKSLKKDLLDFAKDVMRQNLDGKIGELNSAITKKFDNAESITAYPYKEWQKFHSTTPYSDFNPSAIYDVAEKKFMDLRMSEEKGYLVYLFAAEILESNCEENPADCSRPPVTSKRFDKDFSQDLKEQLAAYNEAFDWFVLAYSVPHYHFADLGLPEASTDTIDRANLFTAALLGPTNGMWVRVYSMGNQWDGTVRFTCDGGQTYDAKPELDYQIPIKDKGTLDWWTSSQNNGVYDEVRFAGAWRGTIYRIPAKNVGPCVLSKNGLAFMPYSDPDTEVMEFNINGQPAKMGSAFAIQRAGGAFALTGGEWAMPNEPKFFYEGYAQRDQQRYDWMREKGPTNIPYLSLLYQGKGKWQTTKDTHLHQKNVLHIYRKTPIRAPDGGTLKLVMLQSSDCAKVCRNSDTYDFTIMEYDIESPTIQKSKLRAITGIYLFEELGDANEDSFETLLHRARNGIIIEGSYDDTNDHKTHKVSGDQVGAVTLIPNKNYYLQHMAYYELWNATAGLNAIYYWYRSKLTPIEEYLTK